MSWGADLETCGDPGGRIDIKGPGCDETGIAVDKLDWLIDCLQQIKVLAERFPEL